MRLSHTIVGRLLAAGLCICVPSPAAAEETALTPEASLARDWLLGQVTPSALVPDPHPARRGLVVSYEIAPEAFPMGFHRSYTYDNALAALAFLVAGETDAAAFTLHALARQLRPDGSLWFSYNTANLWPDEGYHESALVRPGALGWAGYALAFYLAVTPPCRPDDRGCARERAFFRETAERMGAYLGSLHVDEPADPRHGLLRLGLGMIELAYRPESDQVVEVYDDAPALGVSVENNISAWFFLRQLSRLTGERRWTESAEHIRSGLLRSAWNETTGQFNRGFHPTGEADLVKALDCASWAALWLLETGEAQKARAALHALERDYPARDGEAAGYRPYTDHPVYKSAEVGAFFFPSDPRKQWRELDVVWPEGTLGVALAYLRMGRVRRAREILAGLRTLQVASGGLRYSSREVPYELADVPGVAASAWLVLLAEALDGNAIAEQFWR